LFAQDVRFKKLKGSKLALPRNAITSPTFSFSANRIRRAEFSSASTFKASCNRSISRVLLRTTTAIEWPSAEWYALAPDPLISKSPMQAEKAFIGIRAAMVDFV
jgi:hypothetical protein